MCNNYFYFRTSETLRMNKYICYFCECEYNLHKHVVDHLVESHASIEIKYRELELNVETGRAGYRTKSYGEVFVTGDDRVGIYRNEKTKKY